jgi:SOS-response transcriptional repressor LexA
MKDTHRTILHLIRDAQAATGTGPSIRDLQAALGYSSPAPVQHHLRAMQAAGIIHRTRGSARSFLLPGDSKPFDPEGHF